MPITLHAGDLGTGPAQLDGPELVALKPGTPTALRRRTLHDLAELEILTEHSAKRLTGTLAMGLAGGAVFGGIGALGGLIIGAGNRHTITLVARFANGQQALLTADPASYTALQAVLMQARAGTLPQPVKRFTWADVRLGHVIAFVAMLIAVLVIPALIF